MKTRRIKVEQVGVYQKGMHAGIRLKGKWLDRMGFTPGGHVEVNLVSPGVMQLSYEGLHYQTGG